MTFNYFVIKDAPDHAQKAFNSLQPVQSQSCQQVSLSHPYSLLCKH